MYNDCSVGMLVKVAVFALTANCSLSSIAGGPSVIINTEPRIHKTAEPIVVAESANIPAGYVVQTISHQATRIGIYHRKQGKFIRWYGALAPADNNGFPKALMSSHGIQVKTGEDGRANKRFSFELEDPGIYRLEVTWVLRHRMLGQQATLRYTSTPLVLYVEPDENYAVTASERDSDFDGLAYQRKLENRYDANPSEVGEVVTLDNVDVDTNLHNEINGSDDKAEAEPLESTKVED